MTQDIVAYHTCQCAAAPVAMPRQGDFARCRCRYGCRYGCRCPHAELRCQYITTERPLGTLMRHFFLLPTRPIALLAQGMGRAPPGGALIASARLALRHAPGLIPAPSATVALAPVAARAHQHHRVAMHARQRPSAPELPTRHWHSPWSHECVPWRAPERSHAVTSAHTLDLIKRRCNNLLTLVADTVGRASRQQLAGHRGCRARSLEQQCCFTAGLPARQAPTAQPSRLRGSSS